MATKKLQILGTLGSNVELDETLTQEGKAADAAAVGEAIASMNAITATDDGTGIITFGVSPLSSAEEVEF